MTPEGGAISPARYCTQLIVRAAVSSSGGRNDTRCVYSFPRTSHHDCKLPPGIEELGTSSLLLLTNTHFDKAIAVLKEKDIYY